MILCVPLHTISDLRRELEISVEKYRGLSMETQQLKERYRGTENCILRQKIQELKTKRDSLTVSLQESVKSTTNLQEEIKNCLEKCKGMPETAEKYKEAQRENDCLKKSLKTQENKFDNLKVKVDEERRSMRKELERAQRQINIEKEEKRDAVQRQQDLEERLLHMRRRCEDYEKRINRGEAELLYNMGQEPERAPFLDRVFEHLEKKTPTVKGQPLDLFRLHGAVQERGGMEEVSRNKGWTEVLQQLDLDKKACGAVTKIYSKYLYALEAPGQAAGGQDIPPNW